MRRRAFYIFNLVTVVIIGFTVITPPCNAQFESKVPNKNNLFVFVGEKIEVKGFSPKLEENEILMDSAYKAKYQVIQSIYGKYDKKIIEFEAYDHFGYPHFANYKNALLFVVNEDNHYYQIKYQYFDVYQTKTGKWATCGDPYKFDKTFRQKIKAVKLEFDSPPVFDIDKELPHYLDEYVEKIFVEPYFKINNKKAECLMGTYVDKLFQIKKEGELKDIGIF